MNEWLKRLTSILKSYKANDMYNADETAIFYKLIPEKTIEFKSKGGKRSKNRLIVMVCSNMSGTDKLPLLVIGKSARPRCFKNVKSLLTIYESNRKAWMTSDMFKNWLVQIDKIST